jgi:hypothetical protein
LRGLPQSSNACSEEKPKRLGMDCKKGNQGFLDSDFHIIFSLKLYLNECITKQNAPDKAHKRQSRDTKKAAFCVKGKADMLLFENSL